MKVTIRAIALVLALTLSAFAQHPQHAPAGMDQPPADGAMHSLHAGGSPVTYAELKSTMALLDRARQATAKYQDVNVAQSEGYQAVGPDSPGMGVHFILTMDPKSFDIEKPPILVYVKDPAARGGYTLAGVAYLLNAPAGPDGQPVNPPFPKSLAHWHRHDNICLAPNIQNPHGFTESQCREQGGHFVAQSPWFVHAWIWKENPAGVFSADNPALKPSKE
jgi:hypothetical protein